MCNLRTRDGEEFPVEALLQSVPWGRGKALMLALIDRARGDGIHVMVGVLDADNDASVAFHRKLGFVEVGRMPQVGRKFDRWLDALLMQLTFPADGNELRTQ